MSRHKIQMKCRCGVKSLSHEDTNSVGDKVKRSGFRVALGADGLIWYMCGDCYAKLLDICQQLIDLLGDHNARYVSLTAPMIDLTKIRHVETASR